MGSASPCSKSGCWRRTKNESGRCYQHEIVNPIKARAARDDAECAVLAAAKALARRTDPVTSKLGAIDAAKRIGALQRMALDAVRMHPDRTATELARMDGLGDPRTYNRRLGELRDAGLIVASGMRACSITGRQAMTWRVVE